MLGDTDEARTLVERGLNIAPRDPYSHYYQALIRTRNGDLDDAVRSLGEAVELGYPALMLTDEPYLEPLRGRRDFQALLSRARR